MKKLQFKINIQAPPSLVYNTMLGLNNKSDYEAWTAIFNPTSTYEGSWNKGEQIRFVGIDQNGKKGGILSLIVEHIPNQFVSFKTIGIIKEDEVITQGENVINWLGGHENYTFQSHAQSTEVTVEIDVPFNYIDHFQDSYTKALAALKTQIENK